MFGETFERILNYSFSVEIAESLAEKFVDDFLKELTYEFFEKKKAFEEFLYKPMEAMS